MVFNHLENIRQFSKIEEKMMKLVLLHQVNLFLGELTFCKIQKVTEKVPFNVFLPNFLA